MSTTCLSGKKKNPTSNKFMCLKLLAAIFSVYLIRQRLRRRVANPTAVRDTGDFSSHFQNMSQGQICYVNIIRPVGRQPEKVQSIVISADVLCSLMVTLP